MSSPIVPGVYAGQPQRGGGGGGFSFDFSGLNPMFNALMSRYGQAMDYQLQDMSKMPQRNEQAYHQWLLKRGDERKQRYFEMAQSAEQQKFQEEQAAAAKKAMEEAQMRADLEKRMAMQASVDRAHSLHTTYGGPTAFNPSGAVADYYEYGAGNPQGRGGGGSTSNPRPTEPEKPIDRTQYQQVYNPRTGQFESVPVGQGWGQGY